LTQRATAGIHAGVPPPRPSLPRALALAALLSGCEEEVLTARAVLEFEPASLDFGKVPTGQSRTLPLRLRNVAPKAILRFDRVALAEGSAPAFALEGAPVELAPGEEAVVRVVYTPEDAEPDAGAVELLSNSLGTPAALVPLQSARTFARIAVDPISIDLGQPASGGISTRELRIQSAGDATLEVHRVSLRTSGFFGEACQDDADCQEGRCAGSATGLICTTACPADGCPSGYECRPGDEGARACREAEGTRPPLSVRGFTVVGADALAPLLPGASAPLTIRYQPGLLDRGGAQLLLESNDADRPLLVVPLVGRPDDLPPTAQAELVSLPEPLGPGSIVELTGAASRDPEGGPLTYRWRFVARPEGSRSAFSEPEAPLTRFAVDRPGRYLVALEVRDEAGQGSSNEARVEVEATAGDRLRIVLTWDQPGADLDLHLVSPGAPIGSLGDCFFENPSPDWAPAGPGGDPLFESASPAEESIALTNPAPGAYTLHVAVVEPSPAGATEATVRVLLGDVEIGAQQTTLESTNESWDVATLSWPSGRLTVLDTVR
jgi:hypothetical protein